MPDGPSPVTNEVLARRLIRAEARIAQLQDRLDIYGPPPKKLPIPELTRDQRGTLTFALLFAVVFAVQSVLNHRRVAV